MSQGLTTTFVYGLDVDPTGSHLYATDCGGGVFAFESS
jgi:hypothetical protein